MLGFIDILLRGPFVLLILGQVQLVHVLPMYCQLEFEFE